MANSRARGLHGQAGQRVQRNAACRSGDAQVASSEVARDMNRDVVLELIRARQPVSRADLARLSGLQRSTVSEIVEDLMREEWVREGSVARRR